MKFTELKNDIAQGARAIYLIEGDDAYFRMNAENMIKSAFLQMPELNYIAYDGLQYKGANLSTITSAVQAFPFMSDKRIVKITDFYPSESEYENYLKPVFENFPSSSILIIVNSQTKKGVDLKKRKNVTFVDCDRADEETVTKWAYITLKRAGVTATTEACQAIASYCLCDMARVSKEVEKFILLDKGDTIKKSDVDELVYKDADYRIYEMTNAVARRNLSLFTEICNDLMTKGFDENSIVASLLAYFKNLLIIATSQESDGELATMLKMKEYGVKKSREQAQSIGKGRLLNYTNSLYSLSADMRSGNLTAQGAYFSAIARIFFA